MTHNGRAFNFERKSISYDGFFELLRFPRYQALGFLTYLSPKSISQSPFHHPKQTHARKGTKCTYPEKEQILALGKKLSNFYSEPIYIDTFLIKKLTRKQNRVVPLGCDSPISYTNAREDLQKYMKPIVTNPKKYGMHSFRSGGATTAIGRRS